MVIPVAGRTGVVSKVVRNDWVADGGVKTPAGREFEPGGRKIITDFEKLGTEAKSGLLPVVQMVRGLVIFDGEFLYDMT